VRDGGEEHASCRHALPRERDGALRGGDHRPGVARVQAALNGLGQHPDGEVRIAARDVLRRRDDEPVAVHDRSDAHRHVAAQLLDPGREPGIDGEPAGVVEQRDGALRVATEPRSVGGREQQPAACVVRGGEARRALEGCRGHRVGAALAGSRPRLAERGRRAVVGPDGSGGQVPGAMVGVAVGERRRQGGVRLSAFVRRGVGVDG
jgi:hypothetical protein